MFSNTGNVFKTIKKRAIRKKISGHIFILHLKERKKEDNII